MTALLVPIGSALGIGGGTAVATGASAAASSTLANIGTALTAGGAVVGGLGAIRAGQRARVDAESAAKIAEAEAQQEAKQRRREGALLASRQKALAAAQGATTDTSILNVFADTEAETERAVQSALYSGVTQAAGARLQGRRAGQQGLVSGVSSVLGGVGQAAGQYLTARQRFGDITKPGGQPSGYRYG